MNKIHILPTGISLVDKAWGGFYLGASYCLIGPHKSGKSMLGLHFARECARQKQVCLYFTTRKPKDLLIQAATIDFDIQAFIVIQNNNGLFQLILRLGFKGISCSFGVMNML